MDASNSRKTADQHELEKTVRLSSTQYLVENIKRLQLENENLKLDLMRTRRIPSGKVGVFFLVPGVFALILSITTTSSTLAFIGLGLTFWGALFFFVRPAKYVELSLLDSTALASYSILDRIIADLHYEGKGFYVPPYPKEVYLPEYLRGLQETSVFISSDETLSIPSIDDMAKRRFLIEEPKGISVVPPGFGLFLLFEKELNVDWNVLNIQELSTRLPRIITEHFRLAKEFELRVENEATLYLKIVDSIYQNLYTKEKAVRSIHVVGCPIVSAIACAFARTTGRIIAIQKDEVFLPDRSIRVWLQILGERT